MIYLQQYFTDEHEGSWSEILEFNSKEDAFTFLKKVLRHDEDHRKKFSLEEIKAQEGWWYDFKEDHNG